MNNQKEIAWPTPIPLINEAESEDHPYPIEALPSIVRNAVITYQQYGQQPLPLIACSALANVSLACQTLANVARDSLLISPVSLYFITVASSGEREMMKGKIHVTSKLNAGSKNHSFAALCLAG